MVAKYLFYSSLFLYFFSYLLPFADGQVGLQIEFEFWEHAINDIPLRNNDLATLWGIGWMTNFVVLALWWLKSPEVSRWVVHLTNKSLLDISLFVLIAFFIFVAFILENFTWQFGGFLWAFSAIVLAISYHFLPDNNPPPDEAETFIERHLVDFDQNELE